MLHFSRRYLYEYFTLKRRILYIFLISTLIPIFCSSIISYYAITSIMTNKINAGIQGNLKQIKLSLENTINNLNHVSQQLSFQGSVGQKLDQLLNENEPYERSKLVDAIGIELGSITFTNPNIGLTLYYYQDEGKVAFENLRVDESFDPDTLPLLFSYHSIRYFGPHASYNPHDNQLVLSALRQGGLPDRQDVYIYIESGFKLAQNILDYDQIGRSLSHLMLDKEGKIVYTELSDEFARNTLFEEHISGKETGNKNGYYWYKSTTSQGWSVISVIKESEFNRERDRWIVQLSSFTLLFLVMNLTLGWLLWRMVYTPLKNFNKEIKGMTNNHYQSESLKMKIPEFDHLLHQFKSMKSQVGELFLEVEQKEKRRADLEIEKLLYQINPHFLMNTLDTAHWLAVMNGQSEIDRLVVSLNNLLYYNLGKQGKHSTVRDELDALRHYLTLQQIRYNFEFDVRIDADDEVLDYPIPRFILQPLVENALYHGLDDTGSIYVDVHFREELVFSIRDNGAGMSEKTIRNLMQPEHVENEIVGMGIGMNYVKRILASYYEGRASMEIESIVGEGTTVTLRLPVHNSKEGIDI